MESKEIREITSANGRLGILLPGLGAVSTTMIAGVQAIRRGIAKPIGSLTQMGLSEKEPIEQSLGILDGFATQIIDLMKVSGKPIAGFSFRSLDEIFPQKLMEHGIPVFSGPERAIRAMKSLVVYGELKQKIVSQLAN